jgi:hypothetical protein
MYKGGKRKEERKIVLAADDPELKTFGCRYSGFIGSVMIKLSCSEKLGKGKQ